MVLPLFMAILVGIIDLGRVFWANDVVSNAAREASRYASVNAGTPGLTTEISKDEIRARAQEFVIAGGVNTRVMVCFSSVQIAEGQHGCTGDTDEASAAYERGNLVTVVVESDVPIFASAVIGGGPFTVRGESTVLINN